MNQSRSPLVPAIVVGLLTFLWLNHIYPPFALTDDGIRDQLLTRDCTDLGRCHTVGANTSLNGFHHGPVWLDLLIGVRLLGGDTGSQGVIVIALMALSAATLFVVVWRWLRPAMAVPASLLFVAALSADTYPSLLINPSITALPDLVTVAGILCFGLSGRRRFLLLAAFALGAAISVHIGAMSLAIPLVAIAALMRERPWRAMLGVAAIVVATYGLTSSAALRANVMALTQPARLLPACVAGVLLTVLCARLGPLFRRLGATARSWIIACLLVVPFGLGTFWLVTREHHFVSVMYLHPILASSAVIVAAVVMFPFELAARLYAPLRWFPTAAFVGVAIIALLSDIARGPTPAAASASAGWTAPEARAIAAQAVQRGWQYEDLLFRLQSRWCRQLLTGISIAAPPPSARADRMAHRALQVVKVPSDDVPRIDTTHAIVALDRGTVAIMRELASWLEPEKLRVCLTAVGAEAPQCAPAHRKVIDAIGPQRFLFITRAFPEIHSLTLPQPYVATYEIPVFVPAAGTRDLAMIDLNGPGCGWRITRVEGVGAETLLPASRVRLHAGDGERGLIVVERSYGGQACAADEVDMRYPPCFFEAAADDALLAVVTAQ